MVDFRGAIASLQTKRPLFHSEADFVHSFAWELQLQHETAEIRVQAPVVGTAPIHVDMVVTLGDRKFAAELKYKTRELEAMVRGERFKLQNPPPQDPGRYDVIKDISRLESIVRSGECAKGAVICLTNDATYWSPPHGMQSYDAFRLTEGRELKGNNLPPGFSSVANPPQDELLPISGAYQVRWEHYSRIHPRPYGAFRYLMLEVSSN